MPEAPTIVKTRFIYVAFRFDDMPGQFPPALRAALHDGVVRAHAALRVRRPHGWIDIDATFDQPRLIVMRAARDC